MVHPGNAHCSCLLLLSVASFGVSDSSAMLHMDVLIICDCAMPWKALQAVVLHRALSSSVHVCWLSMCTGPHGTCKGMGCVHASSNKLLHHIFRQLLPGLLPGCCPSQQRCCVPCCACTGFRESVLWFICYPASWETQCCCCCSYEREGVGIQVVPMHESAPKRGKRCQLVEPTVGTGPTVGRAPANRCALLQHIHAGV